MHSKLFINWSLSDSMRDTLMFTRYVMETLKATKCDIAGYSVTDRVYSGRYRKFGSILITHPNTTPVSLSGLYNTLVSLSNSLVWKKSEDAVLQRFSCISSSSLSDVDGKSMKNVILASMIEDNTVGNIVNSINKCVY